MLVGILDRHIKLLIQPPTSFNQLHTRLTAARLPEKGTDTNTILLVILYPQETIQELKIDSYNIK